MPKGGSMSFLKAKGQGTVGQLAHVGYVRVCVINFNLSFSAQLSPKINQSQQRETKPKP
jgi:hypothetical protein